MELADLLSERDIQELARPTGEASGLPGHAYGVDFFGLETRRLFPRTWCAVAYESDVPTMGDALPVDVAGWPLVLIRGADQQVRVFHNVCRHRQMQVVPEPCKARPSLSCPWHGWTYALDGKLIATPRIGGRHQHRHPEFNHTNLDLEIVRSDTWLDMVFVNIDENAPPLHEHLGPLHQLLQDYNFTGLEVGDAWSMEYPANWKLTVEGAIEDYHLPMVHPEMVELELESHPRLDYAAGCYFSNSSVREYESTNASGEATALESDLPSIMRPGASELRTFVISVFPTGFITTRTNHLVVFLILPDGHRRTRLDFRHYFKGEAARQFVSLRSEMLTYWKHVFEQDLPYVDRVQKNCERPQTDDIKPRFSPFWEPNVQRFQQSVVTLLQNERADGC